MIQCPREHGHGGHETCQSLEPLGTAANLDGDLPAVPGDPGLAEQEAGQEENSSLVVRDVGPGEHVREKGVELGVLGGVARVVGLNNRIEAKI